MTHRPTSSSAMPHRPSRLQTALVTAVLVAFAATPASAAKEKKLRTGQSFEFQLEGNPSTGYKWVLDEAASEGLDLVAIESLGYAGRKKSSGKLIVGAPEPFVFRITCEAKGFAHLLFNYIGPGGGAVADTHESWVRCD